MRSHQVELNAGRLHVRRAKRGTPSVHPLQGDEIRALRRLQREQEASPYVFLSERSGSISAKSFGTLIARLGERAGMAFPIFPHMLRHACGFAQANAGHDTRALQAWLGHKNIQHTVRYTELAPDRVQELLAVKPLRWRTFRQLGCGIFPQLDHAWSADQPHLFSIEHEGV